MHDKNMTTEGIAARGFDISVTLLEDLLHGDIANHPALMVNAHEQLAKLQKANKRVKMEMSNESTAKS